MEAVRQFSRPLHHVVVPVPIADPVTQVGHVVAPNQPALMVLLVKGLTVAGVMAEFVETVLNAVDPVDSSMFIGKINLPDVVSDNIDSSSWALPEESVARLGRGRISDLAFSPDGRYLVVGSSIGLWWYELPTLAPIALSDTERGMISAISFSQDGQWLATGDGDGLLKVWDVHNGICVAKMERAETERPYHWISQIVFSPNSQWIAASSQRDYIVYVWDSETGIQVAKFQGETNFRWFGGSRRPIAFSRDGRLLACTMPDKNLLACAEADGTIRTPAHSTSFITVWDVERGERLACLTESLNFIESLNFSPCGQFLAAGEKGGTVRIWTVNSWKLHKTIFSYRADRMQVSHSPEGILYAAGTSDNTVTVWDVEHDKKCYTYLESDRNIKATHLANGSQLVFATEREFKIWNLRNPQQHTATHLHTGIPDSLAFSLDGKSLVGGYWDQGIMLWDVAKPSKYPTRFNLPGGDYSVSVSPTGKIYAIGPDSNTAKVWEIGNAEIPIANFTPPGEKRHVTRAAFAPKSKMLACVDNEGMLHIWDMQQQNRLHILTAYANSIHSMTFSPDEKQLVITTHDGPESMLLDVAQGKKIYEFPAHGIQTVAFSPYSDIIACGRREEILLWDVKYRETLMILHHAQQSCWAYALAFSPCGQYLASGAWWQRGMGIKKVAIRLWSVKAGENIVTLRGHPTDIQDLAFSPDGTLLASGSYDGTILLWNMTPYL